MGEIIFCFKSPHPTTVSHFGSGREIGGWEGYGDGGRVGGREMGGRERRWEIGREGVRVGGIEGGR